MESLPAILSSEHKPIYEYGVLLTKFYLVYISSPFFLQSLCPISETGGVAVRAPQSSPGEDFLWADPAVD